MGYERRKSPKIKVKRKDDNIAVEKIEMKKRKSPSRKATTKTSKTDKKVKTEKTDKGSSLHILKGGLWNSKNKKRSWYSGRPVNLPWVPLLTLAFISVAPGPTGSFSELPLA